MTTGAVVTLALMTLAGLALLSGLLFVVGWVQQRVLLWWHGPPAQAEVVEPEAAPSPVLAVVVGDELFVAASPDWSGMLVELGGLWDEGSLTWVFPADQAPMVVGAFEHYGQHPVVLHLPSPPAPPAVAPASWVEHMLEELPDALHGPAMRALAKVLHPDQGGDTAAMRALNEARERVQ